MAVPEEQCEALYVHLAQNLGRIEIPELRPGETRPLIKADDYFAPVRQQLLLADRALVYSPMSLRARQPVPVPTVVESPVDRADKAADRLGLLDRAPEDLR